MVTRQGSGDGKRKWRVAIAAFVALGVGLALAFGGGATRPGAPAEPPYLTIFLVDGLAQSVFEEELAAGRLPEMAALQERGAFVRDGIVAFPSMTGYGFYPYVTGEDATRSGVLGLRWLDRGRGSGPWRNYVGRTVGLMNADATARPETFYERAAPGHSAAFNAVFDRGTVHHEVNGWRFALAKFREHWWIARFLAALPLLGNQLAPPLGEFERWTVASALDDLEHRPKVQWISFPTPDAHHHLAGTDDIYRGLVRLTDELIGHYQRELVRRGHAPRHIAVVSDHGVADVATNLDLGAPLRDLGLNVLRPPAVELGSDLDEPPEGFADADVLVAVNGNTMNHIYLRTGDAWPPVWGKDVRGFHGADPVAALLAVDGVELVMWRGDGEAVEVARRQSSARLTRGPDGYQCVAEGSDPFGYEGLCDGTSRTAVDWLARTHRSDFPAAVVRIVELFTRPDTGDLVVTAAAGYDLALDFEEIVGNYRGGHGGIRADQLRVPFILAGPGVRPGSRLDAAYAEDLGATFARLLDLEAKVSGRVLESLLRETR